MHPGESDTRDLRRIADRLERTGAELHWWRSKDDDRETPFHLYAADPTGWAIAFYGNTTDPPERVARYNSNCAAIDGTQSGCSGQGVCPNIDGAPDF